MLERQRAPTRGLLADLCSIAGLGPDAIASTSEHLIAGQAEEGDSFERSLQGWIITLTRPFRKTSMRVRRFLWPAPQTRREAASGLPCWGSGQCDAINRSRSRSPAASIAGVRDGVWSSGRHHHKRKSRISRSRNAEKRRCSGAPSDHRRRVRTPSGPKTSSSVGAWAVMPLLLPPEYGAASRQPPCDILESSVANAPSPARSRVRRQRLSTSGKPQQHQRRYASLVVR